MTKTRSFHALIGSAGVALALLAAASLAQARDINWSVGIGVPGVVVGASHGGYYSPAPVYVPPRPVYYAPPPPVYYAPPRPVYYAPPPITYYAPPPAVYYGGYGYSHGHRGRGRGHGHHGHWDR